MATPASMPNAVSSLRSLTSKTCQGIQGCAWMMPVSRPWTWIGTHMADRMFRAVMLRELSNRSSPCASKVEHGFHFLEDLVQQRPAERIFPSHLPGAACRTRAGLAGQRITVRVVEVQRTAAHGRHLLQQQSQRRLAQLRRTERRVDDLAGPVQRGQVPLGALESAQRPLVDAVENDVAAGGVDGNPVFATFVLVRVRGGGDSKRSRAAPMRRRSPDARRVPGLPGR